MILNNKSWQLGLILSDSEYFMPVFVRTLFYNVLFRHTLERQCRGWWWHSDFIMVCPDNCLPRRNSLTMPPESAIHLSPVDGSHSGCRFISTWTGAGFRRWLPLHPPVYFWMPPPWYEIASFLSEYNSDPGTSIACRKFVLGRLAAKVEECPQGHDGAFLTWIIEACAFGHLNIRFRWSWSMRQPQQFFCFPATRLPFFSADVWVAFRCRLILTL